MMPKTPAPGQPMTQRFAAEVVSSLREMQPRSAPGSRLTRLPGGTSQVPVMPPAIRPTRRGMFIVEMVYDADSIPYRLKVGRGVISAGNRATRVWPAVGDVDAIDASADVAATEYLLGFLVAVAPLTGLFDSTHKPELQTRAVSTGNLHSENAVFAPLGVATFKAGQVLRWVGLPTYGSCLQVPVVLQMPSTGSPDPNYYTSWEISVPTL